MAALLTLSLGAPGVGAEPEAASPSSLKPVTRGLCDRHKIAAPAYVDVVNCSVVHARWADLQAAPGAPITESNVIDRALVEANRLNAENPGLDLHLKLRVNVGIHAPEWAKNLDGPPVTLHDHGQQELIGTVPRFWTPRFGDAYDDLMAKLAARYDDAPAIVDVAISRCMTEFEEPFLRQPYPANRAAYLEAGFSLDQDKACHRQQIDSHARIWAKTRSSLAHNPFQAIVSSDFSYVDEAFTEEMMEYCRRALGERCVLGNNSIRWPLQDDGYGPMYERLTTLGAPIYYQTATPAKIGDWRATLDWAASHGANMVELNISYDPEYPLAELAVFDERLESNPVESPDPPPGVGRPGDDGSSNGPPRSPDAAGGGYWLTAADGGIFAFGDAAFHGSTGNLQLNSPIVAAARSASGSGYWLTAADGGIFAFGDAAFHGSTGNLRLNSPIVSLAATPTGNGYWLTAADGGIFAFGDAAFHGSTGAIKLNRSIVGMARTRTGRGYWLVASDGGIFTFGDATFHGSTGNLRLNSPIVAMAATATGTGYWLTAADGGIFTFGDARFHGATGTLRLNSPIVAMAATH